MAVSIEGVDLNLFLVLHHVLSEGSVTRAAARLHVTPSAVSNSLARLRDLIGDPLLVRNGRGVVATPRAQELAPQIASAIESFQAALELSGGFDPAECRRVFTVASADNMGILSGLTARVARYMPRATLRIVSLDHAVASDALASGDVDVLLGLPPTMPRDLRSEPAYSDSLVCCLSRKSPAARGKLTLKRFLACRHIEVALQGKIPIDYVDGVLSRIGHSRDVALSVPLFTMAATCAAETPYITHLPRSMGKRLAGYLPLVLRKPPFSLPTITILQVWHRRSDSDPASAMLRSIIRDTGRKESSATERSGGRRPDVRSGM